VLALPKSPAAAYHLRGQNASAAPLKSRFFHRKWPYGYATRTAIGSAKAFVDE